MSPGDLVQLDQFSECIAVTIGLTPTDISMHPITRAIGAPTLGPCEISKKVLEKEFAGLNVQPYYYWRYWHGYQVLSRPILALADTKTLRLLAFLLMCVSFFLFLNAVRKTVGAAYVYIFSISLLSTPLYSQFVLISHSGVWIIGLMFASFLLFAIRKKPHFFENYGLEMFFVTGMLTAYVDLFTSPLVTLTIPLMVLFWGNAWPATLNIRSSTATAVVLSVYWATGYASFWGAKWILAVTFLKSASISDALENVVRRLSGNLPDVGESTWLKSIHDNFIQSRLGFLMVAIALAVRLLCIRRYPLRAIQSIDTLATFAWIVLLPVFWLALVRNHSIAHAYFVAPILIPSFALILSALCPAAKLGSDELSNTAMAPKEVK